MPYAKRSYDAINYILANMVFAFSLLLLFASRSPRSFFSSPLSFLPSSLSSCICLFLPALWLALAYSPQPLVCSSNLTFCPTHLCPDLGRLRIHSGTTKLQI
jgi:hypothetical protein